MDDDEDTPLQIQLWYQGWQSAHRLFWKSAWELPACRRIACDVLIIGAGPAGLASAWLLQQYGYDVRVLEHEPTVGGAARSELWRGALIPCGAFYAGELPLLLRELFCALQLQPIPLPPDALALNGQVYPNFWDDAVLAELPLRQEERSALRRFRQQMSAAPLPPYPLPEELPPAWANLATQTVAELIRPYDSPFLLRLLDAYTRSTMGAPADGVSAYCLQDFLGDELSSERRRYSVPGGLGTFCQRIAEQLGTERICCNHTAFHCEHLSSTRLRTLCSTPEGVVAIESAAVIFAGPKFVAKHLFPELPPAQRQAILQLRSVPYLTIHLHTPFRLVPENTCTTWVPSARFFTDVADTTRVQPHPTDGFLSCLYVPLSPAERALLLSEDHLRERIRAAVMEAVHILAPEHAAELTECACFVWGHAMVIPTPEALCGAAQAARRPVGRIVFAHTDNDASPAFENALAHAFRAAETVHRLLRPHSWRPLLRPRLQLQNGRPRYAHSLQPVDRTVTHCRTAPPGTAPDVQLLAAPDER